MRLPLGISNKILATMIALTSRSSLKPVGRAVFAKKSVKNSAACLVTKLVAGFLLLSPRLKYSSLLAILLRKTVLGIR